MDNNNHNEHIDNYIAKNTIIDGSDIIWAGTMYGSQPIHRMKIGTKVSRINIRDYLWTMEKNKGDTLEVSCKNQLNTKENARMTRLLGIYVTIKSVLTPII